MTSPVFDFKAIKRKLDCQEQKAEFEEKNPKVDPNKVVWSPEWGYGVAAPLNINYTVFDYEIGG